MHVNIFVYFNKKYMKFYNAYNIMRIDYVLLFRNRFLRPSFHNLGGLRNLRSL